MFVADGTLGKNDNLPKTRTMPYEYLMIRQLLSECRALTLGSRLQA